MSAHRKISNPYESPFLGIGVGKKKKAEAEAKKIEAEAKVAIIEAETLAALQLDAAQRGTNPIAIAADESVKLEQLKQSGEQTLYYVIGFVVVAVMAGLFLIKRKAK